MYRYLLAVILILPTFSWGQSLEIVWGDANVVGNVNSPDIEGHVYVRNTTKNDLDVKVKRIDGNYNFVTDNNAICWGVCFQETISESPFPIEIEGETTDSTNFVAHVYPDGDKRLGCGPITYVFFVDGNPTDSVAFTMNFCLSNAISLEENKLPGTLTVFPNPVLGRAKVSYNLDNSGDNYFELYNLLGSKVRQETLRGLEGEFEFDASELPSGVYYYALKSEGKIVETKKMVIK